MKVRTRSHMQQKRLTHTLTDKRGGEIKEGEGGKRPTVTIVHVVVRSWLLLFRLQNKISFLVQQHVTQKGFVFPNMLHDECRRTPKRSSV